MEWRKRMTARVVAVGVTALCLACGSSPEVPRGLADCEVLYGEIVGVDAPSELEAILALRSGGTTIQVHAGFETRITVGGVALFLHELPEYVGFPAMAVCERDGSRCQATRLLELGRQPLPKDA
jgi:hypothetical protein